MKYRINVVWHSVWIDTRFFSVPLVHASFFFFFFFFFVRENVQSA